MLAEIRPFFGLNLPPAQPLRTPHGMKTGYRRLSGSNDEARYPLTLEPRLALLGRGRQYRIYQHLSVPEIVEQSHCQQSPRPMNSNSAWAASAMPSNCLDWQESECRKTRRCNGSTPAPTWLAKQNRKAISEAWKLIQVRDSSYLAKDEYRRGFIDFENGSLFQKAAFICNWNIYARDWK
nr:contractile injection system protein, VgrG/Pvc8 family [Pseudomonas furukawaii]